MHPRLLSVLALLAMALLATVAHAAAVGKPLVYKAGETTCEGWLALDESTSGKRPGVIIVHDWMGLAEQSRETAQRLADMGYVALAADIYGQGVRAKDAAEAKTLATGFYANRPLLRQRAMAAFEALKARPEVDAARIVVLGYCFGGSTSLELARAGAPLAGAVSFHGGLKTDLPATAGDIRCPVLVLHGGDDPGVPSAEVLAFQEEMRAAKVDWQLVAFGNTVHSFTKKSAGSDNSKGSAYNEKSDKRSWEYFLVFLKEVCGR